MFYGGPNILPHLSSDPFKSANIPMYVIGIITIGLKLGLEIYKKVVFRNGFGYGESLRQTLINSLRNVYGPLSLLLWFSGISCCLLFHYHFGMKVSDQKTKNQTATLVISCGFGFATILCIPFFINSGLR